MRKPEVGRGPVDQQSRLWRARQLSRLRVVTAGNETSAQDAALPDDGKPDHSVAAGAAPGDATSVVTAPDRTAPDTAPDDSTPEDSPPTGSPSPVNGAPPVNGAGPAHGPPVNGVTGSGPSAGTELPPDGSPPNGSPPDNGPPGNGVTQVKKTAAKKAARKSSRSVFGPSGVDRPDVLTDAETVVMAALVAGPGGWHPRDNSYPARAMQIAFTAPVRTDQARPDATAQSAPPQDAPPPVIAEGGVAVWLPGRPAAVARPADTDDAVADDAYPAADDAADSDVADEYATADDDTQVLPLVRWEAEAVTLAPTPLRPTPAPRSRLKLRPRLERSASPARPPSRPADSYLPSRRRTWVSRGVLLAFLCLQAVLSLRLHNTAFEDEALYLYSGHMELEHLLHGAALQGNYAAYFSGAPVLYPVAAGALNDLGGIAAARALSLVEMLSITTILYSMTRRLFNERIGLCAAVLFSVSEPSLFLGHFATYDATCLFLLATAAWIMVRTVRSRWPLFLLAAPVAALAVAVKYAGLLFVPTIAILPVLAGWPYLRRRVLLYPLGFGVVVGGLLLGALRLGGSAYKAAISSTTTSRAEGITPVTTILREGAEWGGLIFALALIGTVAYAWRPRTEPDEQLATPGGRLRRVTLGVVLTGTALLAPAYQAHLHTDISFQKHVGFGLFFAAPIAGAGMARILGDHFRRPQVGVAIWCLALVLGLVQADRLYRDWPPSGRFVSTFSEYLQPRARYLVEVPEVPIYYLLGNPDAQPRQFTSTYFISYINKKGQDLTGPAGFTAAVQARYFQVIAYNNQVTEANDNALGQALKASKFYYLAAEVPIRDAFGPGQYDIWVKGLPPSAVSALAHSAGIRFRSY